MVHAVGDVVKGGEVDDAPRGDVSHEPGHGGGIAQVDLVDPYRGGGHQLVEPGRAAHGEVVGDGDVEAPVHQSPDRGDAHETGSAGDQDDAPAAHRAVLSQVTCSPTSAAKRWFEERKRSSSTRRRAAGISSRTGRGAPP